MSTIRDVAARAGVSTATVSRVLNNDTVYKMTDETRDRVWKAVAELGYRPKSTKLPLPSSSTADAPLRIGCILSVTKEKYKDPYFMSILSGIEKRLGEKGYTLSFLRTYHEIEDKLTFSKLFADPVDGLILMDNLREDLYRQARTLVSHIVGVDTIRTDIDNVGYDHYDVATRAVQHLIERGHTKIGFIGGSGLPGPNGKASLRNSMRYKGFFATMHAAELPVNPDWVRDCQWDEALCCQIVSEIVALPNRPTALFCASDLMAIAALSALYNAKISVPEEMAVIGLSNIELSQFSSPPLTTLNVPTQEIGMVAVDLLCDRIAGSILLPKRVILPTQLIQRSST